MPDHLDFQEIRARFPALEQKAGTNGLPLSYLDSAATSLKPQSVIDAMTDFYAHHGGAAGRGSHSLATYADKIVEKTRAQVLRFTKALSTKYIPLFTPGATHGLNFVASTVPLAPGQNIILTRAEHHANIVPWQMRAQQVGSVELRYLDVDETGAIRFDQLESLVDAHTAVISVTHASNVTGIVSDLSWIPSLRAKHPDVIIVLDACQSVAHIPLQLDTTDIDFCVFSAHKMYGPSGLGILLGRASLLEEIAPYQTGGGIVEHVGDDQTTFADPPAKFEPGSVNTAAIAGLSSAIDFLEEIGWETIARHEQILLEKLLEVESFDGTSILGTQKQRLGVVSISIIGIHPHDLGQFLDERGVAVRTGHHCAQMIHRSLRLHASTRASLGVYSNAADIEAYMQGVAAAKEFFNRRY